MKCYNCGNDIPDDSTFCNMCGVRLKQIANNTENDNLTKDETFEKHEDLSEKSSENTEESFDNSPVTEQPLPETDNTAAENTSFGTEEIYQNQTEDNPDFANSQGASETFEDTDNSENNNAEVLAKPKKKYAGAIVLSVGLIVAALAIISALFVLSHGDIDGTWVQDIESADIFGVMNQTIIEFDDDGEMTYVSGFYVQKDWTYSYNRFLGTLKMTRGSDAQKQVIITKIKWLDKDTFAMSLNGTVFVRTNQSLDDMGYDTDDDDIVKF